MISIKKILIVLAIGFALYRLRIYFRGCHYTGPVRLDGKTVIVTGANTGIGLETAKGLLIRGARVIMACRGQTRCEAASESILKELLDTLPDSKVEFRKNFRYMILDLSDRTSIENFAKSFLSSEKRLDVLVNNAGVMALPKWTPTKHNVEAQFGINHLGHFLLTHLLTQRLIESKSGRIVCVSSLGHFFASSINFSALTEPSSSYSPFEAYGVSKLANVLHARELSRRFSNKGVVAVSVHPGGVKTELGRYFMYDWMTNIVNVLFHIYFKTPEQGAQTTLTAVLDPKVVENPGAYYAECKPATTSSLADNQTLITELWQYSKRFWQL